MTDDNTDDKEKGGISAWLFGAIFHSGWRRRVFFAVVVILFVILVCFLREGVDYQNDPSALVPRNATVFVETRELGPMLKNAAMLPGWVEERRASGDEQWNHIQASIAGMLGESVHGFGSRLPLSWIEAARRAALTLNAGDGPDSSYWTLLLELPSPQAAIRELRQEPGVTVAKVDERNENLVVISGNDESKLLVGAVGPWLVVSPVPDGIIFAADAVRRPSLTLAAANILSAWPRDAALRGLFDPAVILSASANQHLSRLAGWIRPDSRFAFAASLDSSGAQRLDMRHSLLGEAHGGSLFWSLIKFVLSLVAVACVVLALAIIAAMLGWGGWLKLAAAKAGIKPAREPFPVEPSAAFRQDAGLPPDAGSDPSAASSGGGQMDSIDLPGGPVPPEGAEGEGVAESIGLDAEPPGTFSDIQDADLPGATSGRLPGEPRKPVKKPAKPRTTRSKPEANKSTSAPRPRKKPAADDEGEAPPKTRRRAPKK